MQLIAHRGLTNKFIKENTLEAFNNAIKHNYEGIELDIRKTKDNKIVILHDKLINRTSNGNGNINNLTYKEANKYNYGTKKINSKIPLLIDIIKNIKNKIIFIELKEEITKKELENILKNNNTNDYYIMSFNKQYIDNLIGIDYKLGLINYIFNSTIDLNNYNFLLILEDLFTKDIYEYCINNNIEPVLYNVLGKINLKNKEIIQSLKYII